VFEANLTWADGSLRLSGKGVPADLEQLRERLYESARVMGAGDVAMQLVVTDDDLPPQRTDRWVFRMRDTALRQRAVRRDAKQRSGATR
jgi:hypothetical protein